MHRNSTSTMGAIHPTMFLFVICAIAFVLTLNVCRMVINVINESNSTAVTFTKINVSNQTVLR